MCPGVDREFLADHLRRLDEGYFERFTIERVAEHLGLLYALAASDPLRIITAQRDDHRVECTILSFDYPFLFSLITGVLTGMGLDISEGSVFTYRHARSAAPRSALRRRFTRLPPRNDNRTRRKIVDHFVGTRTSSLEWNEWCGRLRERMKRVVLQLESGEEASTAAAKHDVNELVARRLEHLHQASSRALYPVGIEVDNADSSCTRLAVNSEDTPAFLYSLSNALSLNGISIERVSINTVDRHVRDVIDIVDKGGGKITDTEALSRIKLSVLLTKQFTYFLGGSPNPYTALMRFEQMVKDFAGLPGREQWLGTLSNPRIMQELARLLGASDFLWEDFIRLQYESLLPMLRPYTSGHHFATPSEELPGRLRELVGKKTTPRERKRVLNEFKDREIFLIDLDHILNPSFDFKRLSRSLTILAEAVVECALGTATESLIGRYGSPQSVAGLPAQVAVFGLGKLGGAALGYASDIELLFVYSDNGRTSGPDSIENAEFFERLVKETLSLVETKREGIFTVDLQLRPHGKDGPLACSLEQFCRYYGPGGPAHSYERLALVRMRTVGGDRDLGARVMRIRDDYIYGARLIKPREVLALRKKQYRQKTRRGAANAKFSPGALVDLEYDVQMLQVMHGKEMEALRTPRIHEALEALARAGVLKEEEAGRLTGAYAFLRKLVNGLRMLRGSARDVFLPPMEGEEFLHLARRMGYRTREGISPSQQLRWDFESHTAAVRTFVEHHFGRDALPGPEAGNVADVVLSDELEPAEYERILTEASFRNSRRAYVNLRNMAGEGNRRETFSKLVPLACDIARGKPDPDMALNNWDRFVGALEDPVAHYRRLLSQPTQLDILLGILSGSQFLAETLIRNPGFLDWVIVPENLNRDLTFERVKAELGEEFEGGGDEARFQGALRWIRRREILRIATRDICLHAPIEAVTQELSVLAESLVRLSLHNILHVMGTRGDAPDIASNRFAVLAFGKLGARELNYSSDIDLLAVFDDSGMDEAAVSRGRKHFTGVMERLIADLTRHTEQGYAYRVDVRLRPFGGAGELVHTLSGLQSYYERTARLWEVQALLKLRPVAGDHESGLRVVEALRGKLREPHERSVVLDSIRAMRARSLKMLQRGILSSLDVKHHAGGIRDIEFLLQALQLIHGNETPHVLVGNTLSALTALRKTGRLPEDIERLLREAYIFLRRVEHSLQILEDRQTHSLPGSETEVEALAKRVMNVSSSADMFLTYLHERMREVRECFARIIERGPDVAAPR